MIKKVLSLFFALFIGLLFQNFGGTVGVSDNVKLFAHTLSLSDPAKYRPDTTVYTLYEARGENGVPTEYYMDVVSVYCLDEVCKVVPVRLYWNMMGDFVKYELRNNNKLEKADGKPFSSKDYEKLQTILSDKNSPLRDMAIGDILKTSSTEGVDAISGATTLVIDGKATIKGATLTCYTLWHWANGLIKQHIQSVTGSILTTNQLTAFLETGELDEKLFAIKQLKIHKAYDAKVAGLVLQAMATEELAKEGLNYFEQSADEVYFDAIAKIAANGTDEQVKICLRSLAGSTKKATPAYLNRLALQIARQQSYQMVDLYLELMDKKDNRTAEVVAGTMPLLDREILIARRAYWFLQHCDLSKAQQQQLKKFERENKDYL